MQRKSPRGALIDCLPMDHWWLHADQPLAGSCSIECRLTVGFLFAGSAAGFQSLIDRLLSDRSFYVTLVSVFYVTLVAF